MYPSPSPRSTTASDRHAKLLLIGENAAVNEFDERHRRQGIDAARALAQQYRSRITENKDANQKQAAKELSRYVRCELKDEPNSFSEAFLNAIDGRTEGASQSAVYNCVRSSSLDQKKAGILLIVCLAETHAANVIRYANYLLKMLNTGGMDEETVRMASKALSFLIATCKSYSNELVDRCLDHCQEWLLPLPQGSSLQKDKLEVDETRRLAAAHLSKELALATPSAFFLRVNLFFRYIFHGIRDNRPTVRIAAIDALHIVFVIVSQREMKHRTEWFKKEVKSNVEWFEESLQEAFKIQNRTQKKDDYPSHDIDRWHAVALILNELFRISDGMIEMVRIDSTQFMQCTYLKEDEECGVEWLCFEREPSTVDSVTAKELVAENLEKICETVRLIIPLVNNRSKHASLPYLNAVLMQLLPRMCGFPGCTRAFQDISFETCYAVLQRSSIAAPAIGLMIFANEDVIFPVVDKLINFISQAIKKANNTEVLDHYFSFLFLFVDVYHDKVCDQTKGIIPILLELPLSRSVANVLKMIMMRIPRLRLNVHDGVMASVYFTLTGCQVPPKSDPTVEKLPGPKAILQKAELDPEYHASLVLAIDVLGEFFFSRGALQRIMQYVADHYLTAWSVEIRLSAVVSCCEMVLPFVAVYNKVTVDKRTGLLQTIYGVLRAMCSVLVNDSDVRVRLQVVNCMSRMPRQCLSHLAQPEMLEVQFMALHDEKLEMQRACVTMLGRLAELNPALVLPRLRLMLLECMSQMMQSGQTRLELHAAKMITQLAQQSPRFMRPYTGSLMVALVPKIRTEQKYSEVTTHVLNAISEISVIGGSEMVKNLKEIFDKVAVIVNDASSLHKRESALRCITGMVRATAYVVDPYKDYATLLDDLLRILKNVGGTTIRRECIRTLGVLGAIDPYTYKVFNGSIQSSTPISTALSLPDIPADLMTNYDPRGEIIQWYNYERCTLEEFYPAITVANLMMMMEHEDSQNIAEIAQAVVTIFRSLNEAATQFANQVVPKLIEVCRRSTTPTTKAFFLRQLSIFVAIIKLAATTYMPYIFSIIADAWKEDVSIKMVVIQVLTEMGTAIGPTFNQYTGELIPYLLAVLQTDKTKDRALTVKVMEAMKPLANCIVQHLHLVLPPILNILDDVSLKLAIRQTAIDTVLNISGNNEVAAYCPRMMQSWHHNIPTGELREKLMLLLIEVVRQLGKFFDIFKRSVDNKLSFYNLDRGELFEQYRKLSTRAQMLKDPCTNKVYENVTANQSIVRGSVQSDHSDGVNGASYESRGSERTNQNDEHYGAEDMNSEARQKPLGVRATNELSTVKILKQRLNKDLISQWKNDTVSSKDEWVQWLSRLRIGFLKSGSSPSLRAASSLGDQYPQLACDLFPAAFMSVWTELDSDVQNDLTASLLKALKTGHAELVATVLNLAEFMDHSEKGPLPIEHDVLGFFAEETRAYAKATRYKELGILKKSEAAKTLVLNHEDCQSLITFSNKLNVQEQAVGVVRYAEKNKMNIKMRGRWYEKLNEWEKALEAYHSETLEKRPDADRTKEFTIDDISMHEMRCLEALAQWGQLNERSAMWAVERDRKETTMDKKTKMIDHKMGVIAARGAWAVNDWNLMDNYVSKVSENTQDGSMLRAIVAVHNNQHLKAMELITKVRDMVDSDLTATAGESYERAYAAMTFVQQVAELEECIEFKTRPERRPRIALLWSRRLQGCRRNVEQWQRLVMLRGLVLTPFEMHPLRVKFASMCRKQGKSSMSRAVLRELFAVPPDTDLLTCKATFDKPLLALGLAKQLYSDGHKDQAIRGLEDFAGYWEKRGNPTPSYAVRDVPMPQLKEPSRVCAKLLLKLGEWIDVRAKTAQHHIAAGDMSFVKQEIPGSMVSKDTRAPEVIAFERTLGYYQQAAKFDPKWHKVWHKMASSHFYAIMNDRASSSRATPPPRGHSPIPHIAPGLAPQINKHKMEFTFKNASPDYPIPPPLGSLVGLGPMPAYSSPTFGTSPTSQNQHQHPLTPPYLNHAREAVICFTKALMCSDGSRLEDTLRLLQLWFDYGDHDTVYDALSENVSDLPVITWLEVIPQLMARLDSPSNQRALQLVIRVLGDLAKHRPQAVIYALTVASRSTDKHRSTNAQAVIDRMLEYHPRLVGEAKLVTEELVRCAILWHEQWHDALDEASRVYFHRRLQDNNVQAMFEALRNMNQLMEKGSPTTLKENSFEQTYRVDLKEAHNYVKAFENHGNVKDLNQAWEIYCSVFKKLRDQLSTLTHLDLVYVSPKLVSAKDLELVVPGTYDPSAPVISIAEFDSKMQVITSKQRPRKMNMRGSNGLLYHFLLKGHEDPRQDERVMQLFGLVNTLLASNSETARRNLSIQRYSIIALSKDSGLIGWVPNCDTLHALVKEYRDKKAKIPLSIEHKTLQKLSMDTEHLTLMQKLQLFESALAVTRGEDIRKVLWLKSPSSETWFDRRTNFTRSVATMSMVGHILGLGDRHPSNLMLDRLTGKIVHIDFGDCFEVAMLREKFPERVPFRLTRMLVNAMEVTGLEGVYKLTAERVLKVLRSNQESLMAVLEAFVYDPVINWRLVEGMRKDPKIKKDAVRISTQLLPSANTTSTIIDSIKRKLAGTEYVYGDNPEPLTVEVQLDRLIRQATSHANLCQSYIGWCPFW